MLLLEDSNDRLRAGLWRRGEMGRSIVPVVGRILEGEEWENADDGTRDDDVAIVAAGVAFVEVGRLVP